MLALSGDWRVVGNLGKPMNCSIGFVTQKGVCLDLDYITEKSVQKLAEYLLKRYRLKGYLLVKSSPEHYHLIFNRYTSWNQALRIVFSVYKAVEWGIWGARKGELTLRLSKKKGKNIPQLLKIVGKTDKLIRQYLEMYKEYLEIYHPEIEVPQLIKEQQL